MTSAYDLNLELRLGELELEVHRLKRELNKLTIPQAPALKAEPAPLKYAPPAPRTVVHQTLKYAFEARMPTIRRVVDYRVTDKATGNTLTLDAFSPSQIEKAAYKFAKLVRPSRREWHGDRAIYGAMRKLFAHFGAITREPRTRCWVWGIWAHQRRDVAREIVASLTQLQRKK